MSIEFTSKFKKPTWRRNGISLAAREDVKRRYGYRCGYCGCAAYQITLDHVVPKKKGGANKVWNLMPSCFTCNASKGSMSLDQFRVAIEGDWTATWPDSVCNRLALIYDKDDPKIWMDTDEAYSIIQGNYYDGGAAERLRLECKRLAREQRMCVQADSLRSSA